MNTIAEIVHVIVDENHGAANKNLGDAFLMVWKIKDDGYKYLHDNQFKNSLADGSIIS